MSSWRPGDWGRLQASLVVLAPATGFLVLACTRGKLDPAEAFVGVVAIGLLSLLGPWLASDRTKTYEWLGGAIEGGLRGGSRRRAQRGTTRNQT